ncbi:TRAP transporter substrate-binding protein [Salipaludibacillus sp. CF4.18]|uniref:TRAP transporter substrate-binding protein n=1 Tax=Salipaludibacillus sp. CF4.18 TaxID=3373081 RepID=UPI003EE4E495
MKNQKSWGIALTIGSLLMLGACGESENGSSEASGENTGSETNETSEASGETIEFAYSHVFPSNHIMETEIANTFVNGVKEATNSVVEITTYPGNQLADPEGHFDAAATGVADIGMGVHSYTPSQFPLTSVMELPFISETGIEGSNILWDLYEEFPELQDEYSDVEPLWFSTSEPGQIFTVGKQVKSVEDLEGMRIRSPSAEVNAWLEELGATPISMPMNDVYEALERGVVDGTVGPIHTLLDFSLQEVVDYVTVGDFYMTTFYSVMNQDKWESLSDDIKSSMDEVKGRHMVEVAGNVIDERSIEAIEAAEEAGAEFYELSDEELEEWKEKMNPVIEDWIADKNSKGLPGQEIYDRALELSAE